jgi:hypothetical protein
LKKLWYRKENKKAIQVTKTVEWWKCYTDCKSRVQMVSQRPVLSPLLRALLLDLEDYNVYDCMDNANDVSLLIRLFISI